jgi:hypothetical protein
MEIQTRELIEEKIEISGLIAGQHIEVEGLSKDGRIVIYGGSLSNDKKRIIFYNRLMPGRETIAVSIYDRSKLELIKITSEEGKEKKEIRFPGEKKCLECNLTFIERDDKNYVQIDKRLKELKQ